MRELGTMSLVGGSYCRKYRILSKIFQRANKKRVKKGSFFRKKRDRDMGFFGKKKTEEAIPERNEEISFERRVGRRSGKTSK